MKRIIIDMDEVLAGYNAKVLRILEEETGHKVDKKDIEGGFLSQNLSADHLKFVSALPYRPGFFRDLEVLPHSQEVVNELNEGYELFIVTASVKYPYSFKDKHEWLHEHFPFLDQENLVFSNKKNIIQTDYMIDDHPRNLETCTGKPLIFTAYHNIHEDRFQRVNNWLEVRNFFSKGL